MTNPVKQSLEDNMDSILENLPEEFHSDFKASVATAAPIPVLSKDEIVEQAEQCMRENPDVLAETRREIVPLLKTNQHLGQPIAQASNDELEAEKKEALEKIQASLD